MKRYAVTLTEAERRELAEMTSKGTHRSEKIVNALILLAADEGEHQVERPTGEQIAGVLGTSLRRIDRVKRRFVEEGIDAALGRKTPDRAYRRKADGDFEAHLVALSCSAPPAGFARWSLRLLADRAVELDYIDGVSHETVRRILKKTRSSRGGGKAG